MENYVTVENLASFVITNPEILRDAFVENTKKNHRLSNHTEERHQQAAAYHTAKIAAALGCGIKGVNKENVIKLLNNYINEYQPTFKDVSNISTEQAIEELKAKEPDKATIAGVMTICLFRGREK